MKTSKVVPIVLRRPADRTEVLVFTHPEAGTQLVKGTVEAGELVSAAAVRELAEESGITGAAFVRDLGTWEQGPDDQVWHFCEMAVSSALPDAWRHRTDDDGGHVFAFRWHPIAEPAPSSCHPIFLQALAFLRERLAAEPDTWPQPHASVAWHLSPLGASADQPSLYTPRLILRPFQSADAPDVQRLAGAAAVAEMTLNIPHPYGDGMAEAWIATHRAAWEAGTSVTFAITTADHGLRGTVSMQLTRAHRRGELGYWIGQPYWGAGLATEAVTATLRFAFDVLHLNRVQASHLPHNPASGRVLEKVGMQREGLHRERYLKGARFEDVVEFAVLRREWASGSDS